MTYWKVTDKILTETVNFWKCKFLKSCLSLVGWISSFIYYLCVRWNLHSEIGLNEKKIKFSHDNKITVQVFDTLSSKFPQIIINWIEDTELGGSTFKRKIMIFEVYDT